MMTNPNTKPAQAEGRGNSLRLALYTRTEEDNRRHEKMPRIEEYPFYFHRSPWEVFIKDIGE